MRNFFLRITIILTVVILLPLSFYFIKQLTNLSENEAIVKNVFDKQIETVLFTLNQTSENIISNWITRIDLPQEADSSIAKEIIDNLEQNNKAIRKIEFFDNNSNLLLSSFTLNDSSFTFSFRPGSDKLGQLKDNMQNGYQRIESVAAEPYTILYFLLKNRSNTVTVIIYIHTKTFVEQNLGAYFQQVAQDAFTIAVLDKEKGEVLYSTGEDPDVNNPDAKRQSAWYLPGCDFSIQLRAATIDSLIKERSTKDNLTLIALIVIVLAGFIFLISSIRREIVIAEMKSEFVSNVSHEIRTPLALISMYSETLLLKRFKTPEKEKEYLNVIHNESNRLSEMVNRILTFSKMEKMKRVYTFSDVDVNELIEEVIYTFAPILKEKEVELEKKLDIDIPSLKADREAIGECLINLIDNAVKYGKESGKKVWITTRQNGDFVFIDVIDNGIGIAKRHLPYIFDKFYRVTKGNLAHQAKGSGLGLNIVQQILKSHNGKIRVKSTPGQGSCFTMVIPIKN